MAEVETEFEGLFVGEEYVTEVWLAPSAIKLLNKAGNDGLRYIDKLKSIAERGFELFTGNGKPIRSYGGGIFRIGIQRSMIRIIGFYSESNICFLGATGFKKKGQKSTAHEMSLIEEARRLKESGRWKKREE